MRKKLVAGILTISLSGCNTIKGQPPLVVECGSPMIGDRSGPALVGQEYGVQSTPIPLDSVQFSDWKTAKSIATQKLYATRGGNDTVQVQARFISCIDQPIHIRVRTSFMNKNHIPTEATSAWKALHIQPRITAVYSEFSTSTTVQHYLIEVMEER